MEHRTFVDLEQISQLKARYFRLMDQKQWDTWNTLFTNDVTAVYQGVPGTYGSTELAELRCNGRAELVATVSGFLNRGISIHHGHMPEIALTSPTTAKGIWAMVDYLRLPEFTFKGYGHYDEDYVKQDGTWKIKRILLTRLHCDLTWEPTANA